MSKIHDIPTSIVTGFLGAGKTTALNHLLSEKPEGERWAVLVNEFGQVGVDASLIGPHTGASIREISGGCVCCSAGQAFEVALNRLIRDTSPDRILIEPTGIGHPLKIIRTLTGGFYGDVLDLRATICLVDARKLGELRYLEHPAFQDQLRMADVLVANKSDCYSDSDRSLFMELVDGSVPPKAAYSMISFGKIESRMLDLPRDPLRMAGFPDAHSAKALPFSLDGLDETPIREIKPVDSGIWTMFEGGWEGYFSGSWFIGSDYCFERDSLLSMLALYPSVRVKGIVRCDDGWVRINGGEGVLGLSGIEASGSSRLEFIDTSQVPCGEIELRLRNLFSKC